MVVLTEIALIDEAQLHLLLHNLLEELDWVPVVPPHGLEAVLDPDRSECDGAQQRYDQIRHYSYRVSVNAFRSSVMELRFPLVQSETQSQAREHGHQDVEVDPVSIVLRVFLDESPADCVICVLLKHLLEQGLVPHV